ncbi:MAG: hypothetical protein R3195_02380 [Gemmatimonadota bacterium]|nr:hypothetical protein [Gemmatimonadota bacterium]
MNGSRGRAVLTLALVFAAGAAVGVASDRLELVPRPAVATEPGTAAGAEETPQNRTIIEEFADDLHLTPEQRTQIDLLLDYYAASLKDLRQSVQPQYRALMDSVRLEIEATLDDEQRSRYRALLDERYGPRDRATRTGDGSSP